MSHFGAAATIVAAGDGNANAHSDLTVLLVGIGRIVEDYELVAYRLHWKMIVRRRRRRWLMWTVYQQLEWEQTLNE
jgi:hypothetical protein